MAMFTASQNNQQTTRKVLTLELGFPQRDMAALCFHILGTEHLLEDSL